MHKLGIQKKYTMTSQIITKWEILSKKHMRLFLNLNYKVYITELQIHIRLKALTFFNICLFR